MPTPDTQMEALEAQIVRWRDYLARRQAIHSVDVAELEDHLRERIASLMEAGLTPDEAFLVAVKRMGELDALSREFAREHSERLWKQLVISPADIGGTEPAARRDAMVAFAFAAAAVVLFKLPALFGFGITNANETAYARNYSLFVLPLLVAYFIWKRNQGSAAGGVGGPWWRGDTGAGALRPATLGWIAAGFATALIFANVYPFRTGGNTEVLTVIHLPIALWLLVGIAYAGARWSEVAGRMDFIRFSGELFIYFVLLALGGALVMMSTFGIFGLIGINPERYVQSWIPAGPLAGVIVASWLVEAKQSVVENIAPVLTRLFSPLFALVLLAFLVALVITGRGIAIEREALILFDLLLLLVLCLMLYSLSARDPQAPPGPFDVVQVVLVVSALLADAVALSAIAARITEFGFTPNRVAALGMNVILLVNLAWSAVLYVRFLRGQRPFAALERWQTRYLPVYAAWAAVVVIVFPPIFHFI